MKTINTYTDALTSKLFTDNGAFFAFSNKQFEEKKKEGVKYVALASGLVCPKENSQTVLQQFETIYNDAVRQQVAEFGAEKIISHEYFNHETQITGDNQQVIDVLETHRELFPELFTDAIIIQVCHKCFREAVANDWF